VFTQFQQSSMGRKVQGGTGLGLALSREYARLMGGDISADSQPNKGSVFRVEIIYSACPIASPAVSAAPREIRGLRLPNPAPRILIVDDSAENRMLLTHLLRPLGFQLREARDGLEAVREFSLGKSDLVLMDLAMPRMDGYEAIRVIRRLPKGQRTKVLVITASAFEESRKEVMQIGADGFLRKPFRHQELFQLLHTHLNLELIVDHEEEWPVAGQQASDTAPHSISRKRLGVIPAEMIEKIQHATLCADVDQLEQILSDVEQLDADLVVHLRSLVKNFDYESLSRLVGTGRKRS
jgi:CheY-like chemotaxis protein